MNLLYKPYKKHLLLNKNLHTSSAFTIVELLVVIVIIGILVTITIVTYSGITNKATIASLASDLNNAAEILKLDQVIDTSYPTNLAAANGGKGITASPGTTYSYVVNNSIDPKVFCLSALKNSVTYKITENSTPSLGDCTNYLPVLYLDAGITASYSGSGTTWTDLSGNNNNGTLLNGVGYSSVDGGVLVFDGVNDFVDVGNKAIFDITGNITLEAWVKTTQTTYGGILTKYSTPSSAYGYDLGVYNNNSAFNIRSGTNGFSPVAFSSTAINDNNWHYIVGVYNGSNTVSYKDGVAGNLVSWTYGSSPSTSSLQIGARNGSAFFIGQIGGVCIYNRALSASEIMQSYNSSRSRYGV